MKNSIDGFRIVGLLGLCLFLAGCTAAEVKEIEPTVQKRTYRSSFVVPFQFGNTERVNGLASADVLLASQPTKADLERAAELGIETVINLRRPSEKTALDEEEKIVKDLGMAYENPAFSSPAELDDEIFDRVREALNTAERPILLHCSSANRSSAVWIPYRVLDEGADLEETVGTAKEMGLRSPVLEKKARAYVNERTTSDGNGEAADEDEE